MNIVCNVNLPPKPTELSVHLLLRREELLEIQRDIKPFTNTKSTQAHGVFLYSLLRQCLSFHIEHLETPSGLLRWRGDL